MRSRIPMLVTALGLVVVVGVIWRSTPRETVQTGMTAAETTALTLTGEIEDAFSLIGPAPRTRLDHGALAALFDTAPGGRIDLPLDPPIRGRVNLRHRHTSGALVLGVVLPDFAEATAFLSMNPTGEIEGHLLSQQSGTAYRIETDEKTGDTRIRRIAATDLLCVAMDRGRLVAGLPPEPSVAGGGSESTLAESVPLLESRPGSSRVIYLNFDGETVSGTFWNAAYHDGAPIVAAPFDNPAHIPGIWASVAEDYVIFDVNVTTDRAAYEEAAASHRGMILFTPTKEWYGSNVGGIARTHSFGSEISPCAWVFNLTLNGAAESASHEIGHTLGLSHDGTTSRAYYSGHTHASGVSWGPIMGTSYNRDIVQFSKGQYPSANRQENDLALLSLRLAPLADDHGNTVATATPVLSGGGTMHEGGIIGNENDTDLFSIVTDKTGTITLTASPPALYRNLDVSLELLNEHSVVLAAQAPEGPFSATVNVPACPPGTYHIRVRGTGLGNLTSGYGKYGSIGSYTLTGTFPASTLPDIPTSLTASDGTSTDAVALSWSPSSLADGYRVYRGTTALAGDASLLATTATPDHLDESALPGTIYHYFVSASNSAGESPRSPGESGYRQRLPPDSPIGLSATTDSPHSIRVSWAAADRAQQYRVFRHTQNTFTGSTAIGVTSALSWHDTGTDPDVPHYYFVEAFNTGGSSIPAGPSTAGVKIPLPPGTPHGLTASQGDSPDHTLVSWMSAEGAIGYEVYRHTLESVAGAELIATVTGGTSSLDFAGIAGDVYWYFVRASLEEGLSGPSNLAAGFRLLLPPGIPVSVTATRGTHPSGVLVSWPEVDRAQRYLVYRTSENTPDTAVLVGETTDLAWLDESAAPGRTYRYFVRAENPAGSSDFSELALGFGATADPGDDGFENNDDFSTASPFPSGSGVSPLEIAAISLHGDPDWYQVDLGLDETRLDLTLVYDGSRGDLLLALYDDSGLPVASSTNGIGSKVISHIGLPGATYRVLIERDDGLTVPYRLSGLRLRPGELGLYPDLAIGATFPPTLGDRIHNGDGAGQTLIYRQRRARSKKAYLTLTNRSAVPGSFTSRGTVRQRFLNVDHFRLHQGVWQRISGSMRTGGSVVALAPFEKSHYQTHIRYRSPKSSPRRFTSRLPFASRVTSDPDRFDQVWIRFFKRPSRR